MTSTSAARASDAVEDEVRVGTGSRSSGVRGAIRLSEVRWAAAAVTLFVVGGALQLADAPRVTWWVVYLSCYLAGGWQPAVAGLGALRRRTLDVDLLMVLAAAIAAGIGQVLDGALLIIIFATSGALEAVATKRTRDSVTALLDLAPERAARVGPAGTETVVDVTMLEVGDTVRVRPGERVPADGQVIEGRSDVDQSSVTGESLPTVKQPGAEVFAGTMNGTGAMLVRVSRPAERSVIARIVTMVRAASDTKADAQLFVERIERRYSVGMVAATVLLFVVPLMLGAPLERTLLRAITFMIVASPCAVVLATMPALLSAIATAGRRGVLVKSAVVMEQLGSVDLVAFDKTGTLTLGVPHVTGIDVMVGGTMDEDALLALAAAVEVPSQHPLGAAIVDEARRRRLPVVDTVEGFVSVPGRGVRGRVQGSLVDISAVRDPVPGSWTARREARGETVVAVTVDDRLAGLVALADRVRDEAATSVRDLTAVTCRSPVLLTGDNPRAAAALAEQVGIEHVHAGLLPEDKVEEVRAFELAGRRVAVVGDGINDAPAMAAAHVGVAMGRRGSDLALEAADAVVARDELTAIAEVIVLSRRARRIVLANIVIAAAVITGLVLWDLLGTLPLPLGVAGHEGSTVIVGLNGLRMLAAPTTRRRYARSRPESSVGSTTTTGRAA